MPISDYNAIEFKTEDAIKAMLDPEQPDLAIPIVQSLIVDDLEEEHIAIIALDFERAGSKTKQGNWLGNVRIKTVTAIKQDNLTSAQVRALHRQRVGIVRDTLMHPDLADSLSAAIADFTCLDVEFSRVTQKIAGKHWISEFTIALEVCGADL